MISLTRATGSVTTLVIVSLLLLEGHGTGQDVGFDQVIFAVESLERFPQTGNSLRAST